jgi:hypothetical protein
MKTKIQIMKNQKPALLVILLATLATRALGDGWVGMDVTGANAFWNEYNTPGVGMPAAGGSELVSFIWAPVGTPDLLYSVGSQFGQRGGSPLDQVATNGVTAVDSTPGAAYSTLSTMLSDGWNMAYDIDSGVKYGAPTGLAVSISLSGPYNQYSLIYNQSEPFELQGAPSISGAQIEVIVLLGTRLPARMPSSMAV